MGKTYKVHGTDSSLVVGMLGMETSNDDFKNSISITESKDLKINLNL